MPAFRIRISFIFLHAHILPGGNIRILIIIPTWDRDELLDALQSSLRRQLRQGVDAVIIGKFGARSSFSSGGGKATYIRSEGSLVETMNQGLDLAIEGGYDWAIVLDDDAIPNGRYIRNFTSYAAAGLFDGLCCVGGSAFDPAKRLRRADHPIPRIHWDCTFSGDYLRFASSSPVAVGHLQGCNFAFRVGTARALGVRFDTSFSRVGFRYESDFQVRLSRGGQKICWFPGLEVEHLNYTKGSFTSFEKNEYLRGYDHAHFSVKNFGIFRSMFGILLSGRHPKPLWLGLPLSLLRGQGYLSFYAGYLDYVRGLRLERSQSPAGAPARPAAGAGNKI